MPAPSPASSPSQVRSPGAQTVLPVHLLRVLFQPLCTRDSATHRALPRALPCICAHESLSKLIYIDAKNKSTENPSCIFPASSPPTLSLKHLQPPAMPGHERARVVLPPSLTPCWTTTRTCCSGKACCPSPPVPLHLGGETRLPQGPTHRTCTCAPDSREAGEENTRTVSTSALGCSCKSSLGNYRRPSDKNSELERTGGQWKNLLGAQAGCSSPPKVWPGDGRKPLGDCS